MRQDFHILRVSFVYIKNNVYLRTQKPKLWNHIFNILPIFMVSIPILKDYLNDERLSLTQIAELMDFSSLSHFSRYCSKHLGQSPSDYRQSLQPK